MTGLRTSLKLGIVVCMTAAVVFAIFTAIEHQPTATGQPRQIEQTTRSAVSTTPESTRPDVRFAVIGDSYTGGSDAGGYPPNGWPNLVLNSLAAAGTLAVEDVSGRGGSGYVRRGPEGTIFGEETTKVVKPDDRLVVFFGSVNDAEAPTDQLATAVNSAFDTAQKIAPAAALLVVGPVWPRPDPPSGILAIRDVLATATRAHGGVFVDPLAEEWLWDRPDVIGSDDIHPTNEGHQLLAQLIGAHIAGLLGVSR